MAKTTTVVKFGDKYAVNDDPVPFVQVDDIFGESFRVLQDVNLFGIMAMADDEPKLSDMHRQMLNMIHEEDRVRFRNLVARQHHLKAEQIGQLFNDLMEVASGDHPRVSSSGSARTTRPKAVGRGSAASS